MALRRFSGAKSPLLKLRPNEGLPSLLGWDVLMHFRVVTDARTGDVLFE